MKKKIDIWLIENTQVIPIVDAKDKTISYLLMRNFGRENELGRQDYLFSIKNICQKVLKSYITGE